MASETPAAWAISLVVVPRKPRCENNRIATRKICSRRFSPVMRAPLDAAPLPESLLVTVFSGLASLEVSAYLPFEERRSQVSSGGLRVSEDPLGLCGVTSLPVISPQQTPDR